MVRKRALVEAADVGARDAVKAQLRIDIVEVWVRLAEAAVGDPKTRRLIRHTVSKVRCGHISASDREADAPPLGLQELQATEETPLVTPSRRGIEGLQGRTQLSPVKETDRQRGVGIELVDSPAIGDRIPARVDLERAPQIHEETRVGAGDRHVRQNARHRDIHEPGPVPKCARHRGGLGGERRSREKRRQSQPREPSGATQNRLHEDASRLNKALGLGRSEGPRILLLARI